MKRKILIVVLICMSTTIAGIFLLLPKQIVFSKLVILQTGRNTVQQFITDENNWHAWWPGVIRNKGTDKKHIFNNYQYSVAKFTNGGKVVYIEHNTNKIYSFLQVLQLKVDTAMIEWKGQMPPTNNPFKRVTYYFAAKKAKENLSDLLQHAKSYISRPENVYGLQIRQEKVKDTLLVSTKFISDTYPTMVEIYNKVKSVEEYASRHAANFTNSPMLHISQINERYHTMVAMPIDKNIPDTAGFTLKKMVPGKILVTEVTGGTNALRETLNKLESYMADRRLNSPAIYFESLVTNRLEEADTSKWITKIYYPIY